MGLGPGGAVPMGGAEYSGICPRGRARGALFWRVSTCYILYLNAGSAIIWQTKIRNSFHEKLG